MCVCMLEMGSLMNLLYIGLGPNLGPVQPVSVFSPFDPTSGQTFKINARFFISNVFLRFFTVFTFSRAVPDRLEPVQPVRLPVPDFS